MSDQSPEMRMLEASQGDPCALAELLERYRDRLGRLVNFRLNDRVRGRVDASDVIQETYAEATQRLDEYLRAPSVPFFVWLRFLTLQKLALAHRQHLGVQARDAGREISLHRGPMAEATSAALAAQLVGKLTSPSHAAMKAEMKIRLQEALNGMDPIDREVLVLRHFEHLGNSEIAHILQLTEPATCNRYVRALEKLRKVLEPK